MREATAAMKSVLIMRSSTSTPASSPSPTPAALSLMPRTTSPPMVLGRKLAKK